MPATFAITTLIDKVDNFELVRDELAAILVVELVQQQALAVAAAKDPELWKLRVFLERSNPWAEFVDGPDQTNATPIVNVSFDNSNFDGAAGDSVERQRARATYNIDCFAYGVSQDVVAGGHTPGDERAALECHRTVRLVRNILMAGTYTYLGTALRGTVGKRSIRSIRVSQPAIDGKAIQNVIAGRIALEVEFPEFSPQVVGEPLELIATTVKRIGTGEVVFANFDASVWPP